MKKDKITTILLVCVLVLSSGIAILAATDIGEETGEGESVATHVHNEYVIKAGDTMTGDINVTNLYASGVISGDGSELTNLNADNITSGTIDSARLPSIDAETLDGFDSSDYAMAAHGHNSTYYTKTESDSKYAQTSHNHPPGDADTLDDLDSTDFALNTHTHPPGDADTLDSLDSTDFAMAAHTHDNRYYNKTESDSKYASISHIHPPGDADTLDGLDSSNFAMAAHTHDSRYYLRSEVDMYFLNLSGGTLVGDLNLPNLYASGVISGDGSSLTNLNASYISTGTIDISRLPPNIDADTLDGLDSTDFALAIHDHNGRYYNKTQSDANYASSSHGHNATSIDNIYANSMIFTVLNNKAEIIRSSSVSDWIAGDYIYAETFDSSTGDSSTVDIGNTNAIWQGSESRLGKQYSNLLTYDFHEDNSINTGLWTVNTTGGGNAGETGGGTDGYLYVTGQTTGPGDSESSFIESNNLPVLANIDYIKLCSIGGLADLGGGGGAGKYAYISFGGENIESLTNYGSWSGTYELKRNGSDFDVYKNEVYFKTITPTTNVLKIGGGAGSSVGGGVSMGVYLYYSIYNPSNNVIQTNLLKTTSADIKGVFITPNVNYEGTGSVTVDVSIDDGSSWIALAQQLDTWIDTSGGTGTQLKLKFNLNGSTINYAVLKDYGIMVYT